MAKVAFILAVSALTCLPAPVASSNLFPAMRKRLETKQAAASQSKTPDAAKAESLIMEPVEIPKPMDAGADGYPVLPAVNKILGGAAITLRTVNTRTNDIAARMEVAQRQSEAELARQKVAFEQNLKAQEEKSQAVAAENKKIADEIDSLKKQNSDLRKQAHDVQKKNFVLRSTVHALEAKMGAGKEFAHKSLLETDDSKKTVLDVLRAPHQVAELAEHSRDADDAEDDDEDDSSDGEESDAPEGKNLKQSQNATSFLSISTKTHHASDGLKNVVDDFDMAALDLQASLPDLGLVQQVSNVEGADSLLKSLTSDITTLVEQRKQSVNNLRTLFVRDYRAGSSRHRALLAQQKVLTGQRSELMKLQSKLKEALTHLQGTEAQLGHRLRSLGKFLQKLAHVANAPEAEMSRMLDNLPEMMHASV